MSKSVDLSNVQVGDIFCRTPWGDHLAPGDRVMVAKRTPKRIYLSDGACLLIGGSNSAGNFTYTPWSEEHEAEKAERRRHRAVKERFGRVSAIMTPTNAGPDLIVGLDDVLRDEAGLATLEALKAEFEAKRLEVCKAIVAGRKGEVQ